ncbi:MAG: putative beta-galactosidase, partial [Verrucomicrobia bacterium]|nr:putative beta-galactosidase [Verrucomicrobiota bacterium]
HRDPSRLIHYEGAITWDWSKGAAATDIVCPMYAEIKQLVAWSQDRKSADRRRPLSMCEFSHAMGNSNGSLGDYFDAFDRHRGLQGGFIWEWVDHGIKQRDKLGREYWAYGGDFGDEPNDRNFVCDGLVWPDRAPHPALYEYKHLAQPVRVEAVNARRGIFGIRNRRWFTTLADLDGTWELLVNGRAVAQGALGKLKAAPQDAQRITIAWPALALASRDEVHVTFRFSQRDATPWCEAGHLIAWSQLDVPRGAFAAAKRIAAVVRPRRATVLETTSSGWKVSVGDTQFEVNRDAGVIERFQCKGRELITRGPQLNIWRAPTDNDGLKLFAVVNWGGCRTLTNWLEVGYDRMTLVDTKSKCRVIAGDVCIEISQRWLCPGAKRFITHVHRYDVAADGMVKVQNLFNADKRLPDLPRVGVSLVLPTELENLSWFGRGPLENYQDRNRSSILAVHRSTVTSQYVPYIVPQEHGNHTDVRWIALENPAGGVRFTSEKLMESSASHFTAHDLYVAKHTTDLAPRPEVHLNLDHAQRGLGTASCGPDTLERYRIPAGKYALNFEISPTSS